MRVLPALILGAAAVAAAWLIFKAAERGASSATQAANEAAAFRTGMSNSLLGKYFISGGLDGGR